MQLQIIFDEVSKQEQARREFMESYNSALKEDNKYQILLYDISELRYKKKMIEDKVINELGAEKFDEIKAEIKSGKEIMTDLAINNLMSGENVVVNDEYGNDYEPVWGVRFKKSK